MRITKQPSGGSSSTGGRGEFELAEDVPGGPRVSDLIEHDLVMRYGSVELPTGIYVKRQGGKPRLRLRNQQASAQAGLQAAAILMMPTPIREESKLEGGLPVMRTDGYLLHHIELADVEILTPATSVDGVATQPGLFRAAALTIVYGNQAFQAETVDVPVRMQDIERLWNKRAALPGDLAALLAEHEATVRSGSPVPRSLNGLVERIQAKLAEYSSDLGVIFSEYEDALPGMLQVLEGESDEDTRPISLEQIPPEQAEIRRRVIERWQVWARRRCSKSLKFKQEVRRAYNWSCAVCGHRFPPTEISRNPGVDAAHILPWADYDLDQVSNGLCLCKNHHWAFDEGLIRIVHSGGDYFVELAPDAEDRINDPRFSLAALRAVAGVIPDERLPSAKVERPNPEFLRRLYENHP